MSYTLRGRLESRLAGVAPALAVALGLHRAWAIELVALMVAVGLVLDVLVYDRLLPYQPAWAAVPLGLLELGIVVGGMRSLAIGAPLPWALGLFGGGWLGAQVLGQAVFPRLELSYAERGGELGRPGVGTAVAVAGVVVVGLGAVYATRPPTVHLHGVVEGPLVVRRAETLVGGIVRGGIVVRASNVTLRGVFVVGGTNGITVENVKHVRLEDVHVTGARLDGIHVRQGDVMVQGCSVSAPGSPWAQGIDISYAMGERMSMVEGCTISGMREGIVTHSAQVDVRGNHVLHTALRGIAIAEMSMGSVSDNVVAGANGVAIFCVDHSECDIDRNTVVGTRRAGGGDPARAGVAIEAHYYAHAQVGENTIVASPGGVRAFDNSTIER